MMKIDDIIVDMCLYCVVCLVSIYVFDCVYFFFDEIDVLWWICDDFYEVNDWYLEWVRMVEVVVFVVFVVVKVWEL